jgi:aldehyde:ferredoxin oxidoreductase
MLDKPEVFSLVFDMINAKYDLDMTADDGRTLGRKILRTEHEFNMAAGFSNKHDRLPEFFEEPIAPHNAVWDFTTEEIDSFWGV